MTAHSGNFDRDVVRGICGGTPLRCLSGSGVLPCIPGRAYCIEFRDIEYREGRKLTVSSTSVMYVVAQKGGRIANLTGGKLAGLVGFRGAVETGVRVL